MWLSRKQFDALTAEAAKVPALERNEAILRQQVTWLTEQMNRVDYERGVLFQRLVGVALPVGKVEFQPPAAAPPPSVGVGTPMGDKGREPVAGIDVGALMLGAAAFDDMGDDEAERQGIGRSEPVVALR